MKELSGFGRYTARWLTVAALAAASMAVSAQPLPSRQQLIAEALKDYGNVIGGEAIDARCKTLEEARGKQYRDDVAVITAALEQDISNPKLLTMVRDAALATAGSEKYAACDDKAKDIVEAASGHAKNWALQIRRIQSGQPSQNVPQQGTPTQGK